MHSNSSDHENPSNEIRINLVTNLFEAAISEHTDAQQHFTALDTKGQNAATIAGVFLAGSLALFNGNAFQELITAKSATAVVFIVLLAVLLMISIMFCLLAVRIRDIPIGDTSLPRVEVEEILEQPIDELSDRYERYLYSQAVNWNEISRDLRGINQRKSSLILIGQVSLTIATLVMAILLVFTVWTSWSAPTLEKTSLN